MPAYFICVFVAGCRLVCQLISPCTTPGIGKVRVDVVEVVLRLRHNRFRCNGVCVCCVRPRFDAWFMFAPTIKVSPSEGGRCIPRVLRVVRVGTSCIT